MLEQLRLHAHDAGMFARSYALHRQLALAREWPAHLLPLGRHIGVVYGMGRLHRTSVMNVISDAPFIAGLVGGRKCVGRDWLARAGLQTPPGGLAATAQEAVRLAEQIGWPVVLKRPIGGNGDGVVLSIADAAQCHEAAARLLTGHPHIVVERMLSGVELRVHLVNGRVWEIRRITKRCVRGDGKSSLAQLIAREHESFWANVLKATWMRDRLVFALWRFGVRSFDDLDDIVPESGIEIQVASGLMAGPAGLAPANALAKQDRDGLERAFQLLGSPSGGADVLLSRPGAKLADGGAILELNIPCGMGYLESPEDAAGAELRSWFRDDAAFRQAKGRIPLIIVSDIDSAYGALVERLRDMFADLLELDLDECGAAGWLPALMSRSDAILMRCSERGAMEHGLPLNCRPIWRQPNAAKLAPVLRATLENCGPSQRARSSEDVLRILQRPRRNGHK